MYVNWLALFEVAAAISAVCIGLFGGATLFVRVLRCFEVAELMHEQRMAALRKAAEESDR